MNTKAVLFDLDGTLADTALDLGGALNRLLKRKGLPEKDMADIRPVASHGANGLILLGAGIDKDHADHAHWRVDFLAEYENGFANETVLFEGVNALLAELNALNAGESRMRFLFEDDTVTARCDVAIEAFLPSIFGQILETFCEQTQAVTELLQASHGGRPVLATDAVLKPTPPLSKMRH